MAATQRKPADQIDVATLGARLRRDEKAGGYVVEHIYQHDPDLPNTRRRSPGPTPWSTKAKPSSVSTASDLLSVRDERELLRGKAGHQVMLRVKSAKG